MIELYDILTLENDKNYTVIKKLDYNDNEYYLLNEVDDDEELLDEQLIVKKTSIDNVVGVKPITDEAEFDLVKEKLINELYSEE